MPHIKLDFDILSGLLTEFVRARECLCIPEDGVEQFVKVRDRGFLSALDCASIVVFAGQSCKSSTHMTGRIKCLQEKPSTGDSTKSFTGTVDMDITLISASSSTTTSNP